MVYSRMTIRLMLAGAVVAAAGVLGGCPAPSNSTTSQKTAITHPVNAGQEESLMLGTEPVSGGIFESLGPPRVLSADALAKARLDRKAILELVKVKVNPGAAGRTDAPPATVPATEPATAPATLPATPAAAANTSQSAMTQTSDASTEPATEAAEPPPMAVKYYLQGREQFLQGANLQAMDALEKSLQLDPEAFTVLRLMGRVCFAASQLARGSMYLERAQHLRPMDVEVNYLLGRYWLERKDFDRAVFYLMQADDSPERMVSSVQTPLSAFYLARALQAGGYFRAAATEYQRYLDISAVPVPGYRYDRELSYLIDEQWAAHLAAAENDAMAGDYAAALPHYEAAAKWDTHDVFIASRLVNALVHDNKGAEARKLALAFLDTSPGQNDDAIHLLTWTYRNTGKEGALITDLNARLASGTPDEATAVMTLAAAEEYLDRKRDAIDTLARFLAEHRANMVVLARLLSRVDSADTFAIGLDNAAAAIAADRTLHDAVFKLFVPLTESSAAAAYVKSRQAPADYKKGDRFATAYLQALTLRAQDAPATDIQSHFSMALSDAPDFAPAREEYLRWLLAQEKFAQATELVQREVAADQNNPKAWQLLIQTEASQQRFLSALNLAKDAKIRFPGNVDARLQLASIYQLREQYAEAVTELQSLIADSPKTEAAYRMLVESQTQRLANGEARGPILNDIVTTLTKMAGALPDSRDGQVMMAIFLAQQDRLPDAEGILQRLLANTPDDGEVIGLLAQVRVRQDRPADGILLLQKAVKDKPTPALVQQLVRMLNDLDRSGEGLAAARQAMEDNPDVERYAIICASDFNALDRKAEAVGLLQASLKKFPKSQTVAMALAQIQSQDQDFGGAVATLEAFIKENGENTERLYLLAHCYSNAGNDDMATATMQKVLAIMPDHDGANNDLGYFWADAGTHIAEAEPMIRKAVENEPNNVAFQDSLGWVLYKQGKFVDAVAILEKAVATREGSSSPDVLGHYGDALYRAGRVPLALQAWSSGQQQLQERSVEGDTLSKDDMKTRDYLRKVINAVQTGNKPELSPLAQIPAPATSAGSKSAGPATSPATAPGAPAQ